jgi:hypothetical protein
LFWSGGRTNRAEAARRYRHGISVGADSMVGDRMRRHRALSQCAAASRRFVSSGQSPVPSLLNPLSKVVLQSYQSLQQLSYYDRGVRTVLITTAQFLTIPFFKKTFY